MAEFAIAPMDSQVRTGLPGEFLYSGTSMLTAMNSVLTASDSTTAYANGAHMDSKGRNTLPFKSQASRTATSSVVVQTRGATGVIATIDVTSIQASTPSVTLSIEGYNATTGAYTTILADAAVVSVSTSSISVAPGLPATSNVSIPAVLPETIRITVTHGDTDPVTYSVSLQWQD